MALAHTTRFIFISETINRYTNVNAVRRWNSRYSGRRFGAGIETHDALHPINEMNANDNFTFRLRQKRNTKQQPTRMLYDICMAWPEPQQASPELASERNTHTLELHTHTHSHKRSEQETLKLKHEQKMREKQSFFYKEMPLLARARNNKQTFLWLIRVLARAAVVLCVHVFARARWCLIWEQKRWNSQRQKKSAYSVFTPTILFFAHHRLFRRFFCLIFSSLHTFSLIILRKVHLV